MPRVLDLMEVGFSAIQSKHLGAQALLGDFNNLTAAGNASQASAYQIEANYNIFQTVGATTNSARLPLALNDPHGVYFVLNLGANALNLYPAVGDSFNDLAANTGISVPVDTGVILVKQTDTSWQAHHTLGTLTSSGFVPYTGATANVVLGTHNLSAFQLTASPTGNNDGITANGSGSGDGIHITHAGSGIKLNIETTGSGNCIVAGDFLVDTAGNASVTDEAYGAGWNGSLEVPTKNAVYDKIESLPAPSSVISDTAYGPSWDGVTTIAPSKNAVYDKVESIGSWDNWAPTFSSNGMTINGWAASYAQYCIIGGMVFFRIQAGGNITAAANTEMRFTLPVAASQTLYDESFSAQAWDAAVDFIPMARLQSSTVVMISRIGANWRIANGQEFTCSGFYRKA